MNKDVHTHLNERQRLALAAIAAERVLPVFARESGQTVAVFEDALSLTWLHLAGRPLSKQQLARTLNAVIEHAAAGVGSAAAHAARATSATLEAALHNLDAASAARTEALAAVEAAFGTDAADAERAWLNWVAGRLDPAHPSRAAWSSTEPGPETPWRRAITAGDLPLFREKTDSKR